VRRTMVVSALAAVWLWSASCSSGPCPRGQELREERYSAVQVKARGCVGKNADGRYRLYGKWEFYYASGMKQAEGEYQDAFEGGERGDTGLLMDGREGHWVLWHENGQKAQEGTFRAGKQEGVFTLWHENGQKAQEGTYRDGKAEGFFVAWHENGQKLREGTFRDGKQEGVFTLWHKNGQKQAEGTYRDGKADGLAVLWHENGRKSEQAVYNFGKLDPLTHQMWDEQGNRIK
jgi:antitoxin component YwqK of YwqJK toxin-antitoxin module